MEYVDINNFPGNALRYYAINGGEVQPDLFHGNIFRVLADESFELQRLANQLDGVKFFLEVYNTSTFPIYVSFNEDYRSVALLPMSTLSVSPGGVVYYEIICRIGLMLVYDQVGIVADTGLLNPATGESLLNPATDEVLLNPAGDVAQSPRTADSTIITADDTTLTADQI